MCTSFVADCFHYVGIDLVPPDQILVTPDEITASGKLVEVRAEPEERFQYVSASFFDRAKGNRPDPA